MVFRMTHVKDSLWAKFGRLGLPGYISLSNFCVSSRAEIHESSHAQLDGPENWGYVLCVVFGSKKNPADWGNQTFWTGTVGGRNLAPVDIVNIPLFMRFYTSQVVQDFFHQQ